MGGGAACVVAAMMFGWAGLLPVNRATAGLPLGFQATQVEIPIFLGAASTPIATWKIDRVYPDQRRLGPFRVKLLPRIVAQGVRLEFLQPEPLGQGPAQAPLRFSPPNGTAAAEWRDFAIYFPKETTARLQAAHSRQVVKDGATLCQLEDVTLHPGDRFLTLPRAELSLDTCPGWVSWRSDGAGIQWNLFTNQWKTNTPGNLLKEGS
jgi:hypothetical protein